ncbi:MAG: hypothetical protein GXP51_05510, partial [Deltaproteobacteria bacterium]|nr:hypothetical protein [Deltaproteobacteria bacterium]
IQKDALTILNFEGISSAAENIQTGRYRLVVPLGIVWRGEAAGPVKQFLDFLSTSAAREVMLNMHAVPTSN